MTLGGVASRAKYRTLCLHLDRGTIEKISRKKRKRHHVITTFDINTDTRVLVDTRDADGTFLLLLLLLLLVLWVLWVLWVLLVVGRHGVLVLDV